MLCPSCRKDNSKNAKYCIDIDCGKPLPSGGGRDAANPDARGKRALDGMGVKYLVDQSGDLVLHFDVGEGRTQRVFVNSSTDEFLGRETRKIYSGSHHYSGLIPTELANKLLFQNMSLPFGSWAKAGQYLVFVCTVEANADKETMRSAILVTAKMADEMEAKLTPGKGVF